MTVADHSPVPPGHDPASDRRAVVVGVDGSTESISALRSARRIAELLGAPLEAVRAWQWPEAEYLGYAAALDWSPESDARDRLSVIVRQEFGDEPPAWFTSSVVPGSPAAALIAAGRDARLIVVGSRGHGGFSGLLLGSVSETVSRHAPCPVLVVRRNETDTANDDGRPVLVGVDGSAGSLEALRVAAEAARLLSCPLEVVLVWHEPTSFIGGYPLGLAWSPEEDARAALVRTLEDALGPEPAPGVTGTVREGRAASVLIREAARARLLVVGARGHGGVRGLLLGSVSDECVRHATVPVLVVPDLPRREERDAALSSDRVARHEPDPFDDAVPARAHDDARAAVAASDGAAERSAS